MLDQFMTHHQLKHPTLVTPTDSTMHADYAVTGIPHAVLIDRQGLVQRVKVGSGQETAQALRDKIVELLAE